MQSKATREGWQDRAREGAGCEAASTRQTPTEAEAPKTAMGKNGWGSQEEPDSEGNEKSWTALEAQEEPQCSASPTTTTAWEHGQEQAMEPWQWGQQE